MSSPTENANLLELTAKIISAHIANNAVSAEALPALITSVYASLSNTGAEPPEVGRKPEPAVPVKKSIFPEYIICLEDGKKLKMLKRHLATSYAMSPEQYRAKWDLAPDYPMVAPSYSSRRSELAKAIGLGNRRSPAEKTESAATDGERPGSSGKTPRVKKIAALRKVK